MRKDFWDWFDGFAAPKLGGREKTFRKMFQYLDAIDRPAQIWETGCVRYPDHWSQAGCSTYLFDRYVVENGGEVTSVDVDPQIVQRCLTEVSRQTNIFCDDSVEFLTKMAKASWVPPIDLLYLDSFDMEWHNPVPSAHHHLKEFMAILPVLRPETLVAVDDSPVMSDDFQPRVKIGGKGEFVARYCHSVGADMQFDGYQVGFSNVTRRPEVTGESIEDLVKRARWNVEQGYLAAASHLYDLVLLTTPQPWGGLARIARGEACAFFARIATGQKLRGSAGDWYRSAIECDPMAVDYRLEFASRVLLNLGSYTGAVNEARRATAIEPDNYRAWSVLAGVLHEDNQAVQAKMAYDKAIDVVDKADHEAVAAVKLNRATIALDMADYGLTEKLCHEVIAGGTDRIGDATHVIALSQFRQSMHEQANETFQEALRLGARDPGIVRWHRSHALEAVGRYRAASVEREQRANQTRLNNLSMPMKRFSAPVLPALWDGRPPPLMNQRGRRTSIHVHTEAGSGDNFALARYVPILAEMGYDVRYEVMNDMFDLMQFSFKDAGVTVVRVAPDYPGALRVEPFDYHCPIGSLMHAFGTEVDKIPWSGPYLKADPALVGKYEKKFGNDDYRVGLCWSSGIIRDRDVWLESYGRRKSMHFNDIAPISDVPTPTFVSLQVGPERKQNDGSRVKDFLPEFPTWADTAALIACLDLVITVDTGVAHLAGAMGKPVWVMTQRNSSSWHFMCWRPKAIWNERSPWYPNTSVFRQHKFDEYRWDEVVCDVATALEKSREVRKVAIAAS